MEDEAVEQISAEQILKEVYEKRKIVKPSTKVDILDLEELHEYQRRKRSEYETYLKRNRLDMGQWIRYAQFEIEQHDIRRARSVFERGLLVDGGYVPLWVRYIDAEVKLKFINHARNLLDRAVNLLPRVDKFWYKYLLMEESLGNFDIVRSLFTKWISLEPNANAWDSFVDFEMRQERWENAREVFARYVLVHPSAATWLKWVRFETTHGDVNSVRKVYELAVDTLLSFQIYERTDELIELVISFATWESSEREFERARSLYAISIQKWPQSQALKDSMLNFEKTFGSFTSAEENVIVKRRRRYEDRLRENPRDFDTWWLYLNIIEEHFRSELSNSLEKSVHANEPQTLSKNIGWKQYILLWMRLLLFSELEVCDIERTRMLYKRLIDNVIPHKHFTFSKIWLMYAEFEIRQGDVSKARKILGRSIGMCPKPKTFKRYIELEIKLKQFDRVRKLYEKYLEFDSSNVSTWISYAELEENLGDEQRCRAIYDLAISKSAELDLSQRSRQTLMQRAIAFETDEQEFTIARNLHERYVELDGDSPATWINYAHYESSVPSDEQLTSLQEAAEQGDEDVEFKPAAENYSRSRKVFERALKHFKQKGNHEGRIAILEAYKDFEDINGTVEEHEAVLKRMPQVTTRLTADGIEKKIYVFPEDENGKEKAPNVSKLLAFAKKWDEAQR
ncbi:hypothetical protein HG536_0C01440 [Torulaspora globosa]|uniref:Pre-mRNA-splicing factor CLF1 n=1 Tax=Torulaspora globosa TaxID=48254 RepID=A0A7G3ZEP0_9SACH|nr:uncharacterized protein HG536_0C01440 [Torulaspora globosa]QLL31976.1 hypothetical protein HG536_0C01440 [Torulaspora globosa]